MRKRLPIFLVDFFDNRLVIDYIGSGIRMEGQGGG